MKNNPITELRTPVIRVVEDTVALEINVLNRTHEEIKVCDNILFGWWREGSAVVRYGMEATNSNNFEVFLPGETLRLNGEMLVGDQKGMVTFEGQVFVSEPQEVKEIPHFSVILN